MYVGVKLVIYGLWEQLTAYMGLCAMQAAGHKSEG